MVSCGFYHHLVSWIYLIRGGWTRQRKYGITEEQEVGLFWGHNLPVDANIQPCFQHFIKFTKLTVSAIKVAKQHMQQPNKLHHAGMIMKISLPVTGDDQEVGWVTSGSATSGIWPWEERRGQGVSWPVLLSLRPCLLTAGFFDLPHWSRACAPPIPWG